jgi:hypothetical protein
VVEPAPPLAQEASGSEGASEGPEDPEGSGDSEAHDGPH